MYHLGAPNELFCKKLFHSGYSAGKIDPVLCFAGKVTYIRWETFFLELWTIFENLLKLWMFVMKRIQFSHVMQLAEKNISAIFLGVKNTF